MASFLISFLAFYISSCLVNGQTVPQSLGFSNASTTDAEARESMQTEVLKLLEDNPIFSNQFMANQILNHLSTKYSDRDHTVLVYNPISGYNKQSLSPGTLYLQVFGRDVVILSGKMAALPAKVSSTEFKQRLGIDSLFHHGVTKGKDTHKKRFF